MKSKGVHCAVRFFNTAMSATESAVRMTGSHVSNQADLVFDVLATEIAGELPINVNFLNMRPHHASEMKRQGAELAQE